MLLNFLYSLVLWVPLQGVAQDECRHCHARVTPEIHAAHVAGVHARLTCVGCHGGNPAGATQEAGHDPVRGYRGVFSRKDTVASCIACHADAGRMALANLDTGVVARWKQGPHGRLFASGDARGPDCVTCHGVHGIRSRHDKASPTYRTRIAASCGACHSHPEKMAPSKLPTDQEELYRTGVHGRILAGKRPGRADLVPTCIDCHGDHGATPRHAVTAPAVCGTCHVEVRKFMESGAHDAALRLTGSPSCTTCHGNHHNSIPRGGLLDKTCGNCHADENDARTQIVPRMREILARADELAAAASRSLAVGATPDREATSGDEMTKRRFVRAEHERILAGYSHLRRLSHTLDIDALEESLERLEATAKSAASVALVSFDNDQAFSRTTVTLILTGLVVALVLASLGLAYALRRLARRADRGVRAEDESHASGERW